MSALYQAVNYGASSLSGILKKNALVCDQIQAYAQ